MSKSTESSSKRSVLRRIGMMGVAVMLLTSGALTPVLGPGASPVQQAEASHECGMLETIGGYMLESGGLVEGVDTTGESACTENHVDDAVEQLDAADAEQTKYDIWNAANAHKGQAKDNLVTKSNYLTDTESIVRLNIQSAISKAAINNRSEAEATSISRDVSDDYYATKQMNLIESWEMQVATHQMLRDRAASEDGINDYFVGVNSHQVEGYDTKQVTLVNGSTVQVRGIIATHPGDTYEHWIGPSDGETDDASFHVEPHNDTAERLEFGQTSKYRSLWQDIEKQNNDIKSEMDVYVEGIWQGIESGEIDPVDVRSRVNLMTEYGSSATNSTGTYGTIAGLAAMGLETPNLDNSGYMTVEYGGETVEGVLVGNAPGGEWRSGMSYDMTTFDDAVQMATLDGSLEKIEGDFRIVKITDKSGNEISSVSTQEQDYQVSNTTEQQQLMQEISDLRDQIEDREIEVNVNGGGSSDSGGPLSGIGSAKIAALAAVLVGAALLIQQTNN